MRGSPAVPAPLLDLVRRVFTFSPPPEARNARRLSLDEVIAQFMMGFRLLGEVAAEIMRINNTGARAGESSRPANRKKPVTAGLGSALVQKVRRAFGLLLAPVCPYEWEAEEAGDLRRAAPFGFASVLASPLQIQNENNDNGSGDAKGAKRPPPAADLVSTLLHQLGELLDGETEDFESLIARYFYGQEAPLDEDDFYQDLLTIWEWREMAWNQAHDEQELAPAAGFLRAKLIGKFAAPASAPLRARSSCAVNKHFSRQSRAPPGNAIEKFFDYGFLGRGSGVSKPMEGRLTFSLCYHSIKLEKTGNLP